MIDEEDEDEEAKTVTTESTLIRTPISDLNYKEFKEYKKTLRISRNKEVMEKYRYLYDYDFGYMNDVIKIEQEDVLSAKTFDSDNELPSQFDDISPTLKREPSKINKSSSFNSDINPKDESTIKTEHKLLKNEHVKEEGNIKKEIKKENDFVYILDDDDEDVSFVKNEKKKLKYEAEDLEGTLIEGIQNYEKINTAVDGSFQELKEFKVYNPMVKQRGQYVDSKKEFFVCQSGVKENMNKHLTEPLEKIMKVYESFKDKGRS